MTIAVQKKNENKKQKILLLLLSCVKEPQWSVSLRNTGKRV